MSPAAIAIGSAHVDYFVTLRETSRRWWMKLIPIDNFVRIKRLSIARDLTCA